MSEYTVWLNSRLRAHKTLEYIYMYIHTHIPIHTPYFSDYKMHFSPQIWEENGGASYGLNVAYLARYRISALKDVIKYFTTFFASKIFFLFSSSKT